MFEALWSSRYWTIASNQELATCDFRTNHHRSNGELLRIRLIWTALVLHVRLVGNPGLKRGQKHNLRSIVSMTALI